MREAAESAEGGFSKGTQGNSKIGSREGLLLIHPTFVYVEAPDMARTGFCAALFSYCSLHCTRGRGPAVLPLAVVPIGLYCF